MYIYIYIYIWEFLNILRTKRAFNMKRKTFFIIFTELSVVKNCLRHERGKLVE